MTTGPIQLTHRPVTDTEDLEPIARLAGLAFGYSNKETTEWFADRVGRANIRVTESPAHNAPLGVACRIPMGLYLAGKEVPQLGVLGVGVAPEARGMGVARAMMTDCVNEMRDAGYPLSALYSAMHPLYRGVAYENAGLLCDATIPAGMIQAPKPTSPSSWREATDTDTPAIRACDAAYSRNTNGMLARVDYLWRRIEEPLTGPTRCFVAPGEQGTIEAFCYYTQEKTDATNVSTGTAAGARMRVAALAWSTPRGFEQIRAFLRGFSSVVGEILVSLPPDSPLLHTLPDRRYALTVREPWMLRILNVKTALEARGYPRGFNATLTLSITDEQIEANNGAWTVTITNGRASVDPGASGDPLGIDIRDLAPLYTGFTGAHTLRTAGRLTCTDNTAETANAIFATPSTPAMVDMF